MSQVAMVSHTSTRPSCTLLHQAVVFVKATVLSGDPHIAHLGYCCSAPPQTLPSLAQLFIQLLTGDQVRRCRVWRLSSFWICRPCSWPYIRHCFCEYVFLAMLCAAFLLRSGRWDPFVVMRALWSFQRVLQCLLVLSNLTSMIRQDKEKQGTKQGAQEWRLVALLGLSCLPEMSAGISLI
jgi:hypothetical protein